MFALKDMTQMAVAETAQNFYSKTVSIGHAFYGPRNFIVKCWPATVGLKFIFRSIEGLVTLSA